MTVLLQTLPAATPREVRKQVEDLVAAHNQLERTIAVLRATPAAASTIKLTLPILQQISQALAASGAAPLPVTALTGALPAPPDDLAKFLNGAASPAYTRVTSALLLMLTDAVNDVTTVRHGFVPALSGNANEFFNGAGGYTTPAATAPVIRTITFADSPYSPLSDDGTLLVDATGGAVDITLPTPAALISGRTLVAKKIDASANAVTLLGTIDDVVNLSWTVQYQSYTVQVNAAAWWII